MVFETALMLSVATPVEVLKMIGLSAGSLLFIFMNWNSKGSFEQFISIEAWQDLFKVLLKFINGNQIIFEELCLTIAQSREILDRHEYKKMSGGLQNSFNDLNHEMEEVQALLFLIEQQMLKK